MLLSNNEGKEFLLMGNQAIARGALEAGVSVAAGYPGTPSSEIIENLASVAPDADLYVEWSVNEKVSLEVAAAGSFAGLRSLCVMKQNGVNVASDFLLHLVLSGTRGGMVLIPCDDPGAISSVNEGESRYFARLMEIPLLEPGDFQEAKDMTKWAFELSEELGNVVMLRSVTRLSHASGNVKLGALNRTKPTAEFNFSGNLLDAKTGPVITAPVPFRHTQQQAKLKKAAALFETSPFNRYEGPEKPELLIITSSACYLYSREALRVLDAEKRAGILKLGTTWPLPPELLKKHLAAAEKVLIVEEVLPFLEENIKIFAMDSIDSIGKIKFFGKNDGTLPSVNEMNPDHVIKAISSILSIPYTGMPEEYEKSGQILSFTKSPNRELTFCPGCPHRASYWSINRALTLNGENGFVCGDIGCYTMAILPAGFGTIKTAHSMGSGTGVASGFGKLKSFGMKQPVVSVCGDSTFFHAGMPALVNAVHNNSDMLLVILDNSGTAMTGFQPHPGIPSGAAGNELPGLDIENICRSIGAKTFTADPFNIAATEKKVLDIIENETGARVLIMKQPCALSPEKKGKKKYNVSVDSSICKGTDCGCNRLCTRVFRCPGLVWDNAAGKAVIDEIICAGCGVCADICPSGAIKRSEVVL
ncbi:MAG TPA: thiamine pyrophosphate-dependent enzyme [Spirochaetota bacterium]|nr:thiamine pyrophosphate-dependent enzyme [Spirochaetota bacterium]